VADPRVSSRMVFKVRDLCKYYPMRSGMLSREKGNVKAVDNVDLDILENETLGLVGESGCGKTTLGRTIIQAIRPTSGEVLYYPETGGAVDLASIEKSELKPYKRDMQYIFQDPYNSLNPRMTLLDIVGEPLVIHGVANGRALRERVEELLSMVGLRSEYAVRYPHAFSGGQRQRIGIARALALNPRFVVCDEPVSSLDVSIQAQILNLLKSLQDRLGLTYLFVAHDLSVVEYISDRVAVMYVGRIVEQGETQAVFQNPLHPYTESLLSAVPRPDPNDRVVRIPLKGEVASSANPPSGCYFHPRCRYAQEICERESPVLRELRPGHLVSCHLAEELRLRGTAQL